MEEARDKAGRLVLLIKEEDTTVLRKMAMLPVVVTSKYLIDEDSGTFIDLNLLATRVAEWRERKGFSTDTVNIPEKLCLLHSEVSEALEEVRKHDILPQEVYFEESKPCGFPIELADALIRILDLSASLNIDLAHSVALKMEYNETREHKHGKTI